MMKSKLVDVFHLNAQPIPNEPLIRQMFDYAADWVTHLYGDCDPLVNIWIAVDPSISTAATAFPGLTSVWHDVTILIPENLEQYQLAQCMTHELVHCLRPNGPPGSLANNLEEGLAEQSVAAFVDHAFNSGSTPYRDHISTTGGKYTEAFNLVSEVVENETWNGMVDGVKSMRLSRLPFFMFDADMMEKVWPNTPRSVLDQLAEKFP